MGLFQRIFGDSRSGRALEELDLRNDSTPKSVEEPKFPLTSVSIPPQRLFTEEMIKYVMEQSSSLLSPDVLLKVQEDYDEPDKSTPDLHLDVKYSEETEDWTVDCNTCGYSYFAHTEELAQELAVEHYNSEHFKSVEESSPF